MTEKHVIPLGTLVEIVGDGGCLNNGVRLFVGRHSFDCDQTPLYDLVFDKDYIGMTLDKHQEGVSKEYYAAFASMYNAKYDSGYTKECLKIISLPSE